MKPTLCTPTILPFETTRFTFDTPERWQLLFQDAATKVMDNIVDLTSWYHVLPSSD